MTIVHLTVRSSVLRQRRRGHKFWFLGDLEDCGGAGAAETGREDEAGRRRRHRRRLPEIPAGEGRRRRRRRNGEGELHS